MCGLDKERKNWKVGGQFGGGWNNVVRHCALINKHFKEFLDFMESTWWYISLSAHSSLSATLTKPSLIIQNWQRLERKYHKHPHKFWMATVCEIHILPPSAVLRVSSLSKNPTANYGSSPYCDTSPSEPAALLGACDVIGCNWHPLLVSGACTLSLRKIYVTILVSSVFHPRKKCGMGN